MKTFLILLIYFSIFFPHSWAQTNYGQELLKELNEKRNILENSPRDKNLSLNVGSLCYKFSNYLNDANQIEKAQKFIYDAEYYHLKALEIDSLFFDAISSFASMNYNLSMIDYDNRINLTNGDKLKYAELTVLINHRLEVAHSYFVKAEQINPSDINIIISFQEIYAVTKRKVLSQEYENRRKLKEQNPGMFFDIYDKHPISSKVEL